MTMTTASLNDRAHTGGVSDDDIDPAARPTRRSFTAEYKAEILAEYDSHPKGSSERGAILTPGEGFEDFHRSSPSIRLLIAGFAGASTSRYRRCSAVGGG